MNEKVVIVTLFNMLECEQVNILLWYNFFESETGEYIIYTFNFVVKLCFIFPSDIIFV